MPPAINSPKRSDSAISLEPAPPAASAVERIASELREQAIAAEEGDCLGSEDELSEAFGVSKPTLRQAARVLQYEEILEVRRGVRGGYFARRPKLEIIARLAAIYLRSASISVASIDVVLDALGSVVITSIIRNGKTEQFAPFAVAPAKAAKDLTREDMMNWEGRFARLIMDATGNFALQLIFAIFYQYGFTMPRKPDRSEPIRGEIVRLRVALANAIVARDPDAAAPLFNSYRHLISSGVDTSASKPARKRRRG